MSDFEEHYDDLAHLGQPEGPSLMDLAGRELQAAQEGRRCEECGVCYPLTDKHWHREGLGFRRVCKICRNRVERERELFARNELIKSIDEKAMGFLSLAAEQGGSALPHSSEVFQLVLMAVGGPSGLARLYVSNMLAAKPGSPVRQKALDRILSMSERLSEGGHAEKDTEHLTEEELYGKAAVLMKEMVRRTNDEKMRLPNDPAPAINLRAITQYGPQDS